MAKSIRSKVKKRNRSYMRATIGEKVRTSNIESAAARLSAKQEGHANTRTLVAMKGALKRVDLGKAYYEAVVRPSREVVPLPPPKDDEAMQESSDEEEDEEDAEEKRKVFSALPTKGRRRSKLGRKQLGRKLNSSGVFSSSRGKSTRPPKQMASF